MADIEVKNKSSQQPSSATGGTLQSQGSERESGGTSVSRTRGWDPFSISPGDFFNNPFAVMRRMSEEMDRTFGRMFGETPGSGRAGQWYPAIEVSEKNGQLQVCAELPGLNPDDVKIEITNESLVVHGERKSEHEHRIGRAYRSERQYGEFYREIALPEGANAEQARAQFRNGLLEITVPVAEGANVRRRIPIQSGESSESSAGAAASGKLSSQAAGASTNK
jgi:HSP20 family protein